MTFARHWTEDNGEGLTEEEWKNNLYCLVSQGKQIQTSEEKFPLVRGWLYELACWLDDNKQGVYTTICLNELMRLERKFGVLND